MAHVAPAYTRLESYPWRCVLPTRYGDQDPNQHINNVALISLFEEGRIRFNIAVDGGAHRQGMNTVAANLNVNFLAEALYPLDITMALGFARMGRTSWTLIEGAFHGEQCLAVCEAVLVAVGPNGPVPLPESWREAATRFFMRD